MKQNIFPAINSGVAIWREIVMLSVKFSTAKKQIHIFKTVFYVAPWWAVHTDLSKSQTYYLTKQFKTVLSKYDFLWINIDSVTSPKIYRGTDQLYFSK